MSRANLESNLGTIGRLKKNESRVKVGFRFPDGFHEDVRELFGLEPVSLTILKSRWGWFGLNEEKIMIGSNV